MILLQTQIFPFDNLEWKIFIADKISHEILPKEIDFNELTEITGNVPIMITFLEQAIRESISTTSVVNIKQSIKKMHQCALLYYKNRVFSIFKKNVIAKEQAENYAFVMDIFNNKEITNIPESWNVLGIFQSKISLSGEGSYCPINKSAYEAILSCLDEK